MKTSLGAAIRRGHLARPPNRASSKYDESFPRAHKLLHAGVYETTSLDQRFRIRNYPGNSCNAWFNRTSPSINMAFLDRDADVETSRPLKTHQRDLHPKLLGCFGFEAPSHPQSSAPKPTVQPKPASRPRAAVVEIFARHDLKAPWFAMTFGSHCHVSM